MATAAKRVDNICRITLDNPHLEKEVEYQLNQLRMASVEREEIPNLMARLIRRRKELTGSHFSSAALLIAGLGRATDVLNGRKRTLEDRVKQSQSQDFVVGPGTDRPLTSQGWASKRD